MTATIERPSLTGTTALRFITAEILGTLDALGVTPKSLTVDLWAGDGAPARTQIWFTSYADMQKVADHYGIGDRVNANQSWESGLLHMGRNEWESGCPSIAGVRIGVRLVADRP